MDFLVNNWSYILIGILAVDKYVAMSSNSWDDLIWSSIKKSIYKLAGKK